MAEEKDGPSGFKVVDRRTFGVDGARRPEPAGEEKPPEPPAPPPRAKAPEEEPELEAFQEEEGSGFATLVSYLSTTAMFQLGLLQGPSGERIPADLPNARRTIDLLAVLQEKTQGNLTEDESRLLEEALYELRMSYVEIEKRAAAPRR